MAKKKISYSFKNATITRDDNGRFILTEYTKDDVSVYNLSELLNDTLEIEGVSLSLSSEENVPSIEDD